MEKNNSADRVLDLMLNQLEKLNSTQEKLSEEIQRTNLKLAEIGNIQGSVSDQKAWKEAVEKIISTDDLREMKKFFSENNNIEAEVTDLFTITKELREITDDYKKFKIRAMTIISVISFAFTTALTLVVKFVH